MRWRMRLSSIGRSWLDSVANDTSGRTFPANRVENLCARTNRGRRQSAGQSTPCCGDHRGHGLPMEYHHMNLQLSLAPIISLLAGILILAQPRLLNYIVAIYLIVIGLLGLFGGTSFHVR